MWVSLWVGVAMGQTWTSEARGVLVAEPGTITENGVGSPTVVWDPSIERYVMFFETQTGASDATCPAGYWSIGAAASDDGATWDVWPDPVIAPTPGTPWRCVAAHPSAVLDGSTYHLYFKSEQGNNACAGGNLSWGCSNYTGVSHATVDVRLDDFTNEIATLQAEIDVIDADRETAMATFETDLETYRADLVSNEDEFSCNEGAPVCTPCPSVTLSARTNRPDDHTFCQDFEFAVPTTVGVSAGASTTLVFSLTVTRSVGSQFTCLYRYNAASGGWLLDFGSNPAVDNKCSDNTVGGSLVTAGTVTLGVLGAGGGARVSSQLDAVNLADQGVSTGVFDSIDALAPMVQARDYDGTVAAMGNFVNDVTVMFTWLSTFPRDPEKAALRRESFAMGNEGLTLSQSLQDWQVQLDDLDTQMQGYTSYTQDVAAVLDSGVALALSRTLGYPSVMKVGADWLMLVQDYPDIKRAWATAPEGPFTMDSAPVITHGTVSWAMNEVFDPNLVCEDGSPLPYQALFGGRTLTNGVVSSGGISDALSSDTVTWLVNVASQMLGWSDPNSYRHFDVVRSSDGEYRMWYSEKVNNLNQISVNVTTPTWDDTLSTQRVCP